MKEYHTQIDHILVIVEKMLEREASFSWLLMYVLPFQVEQQERYIYWYI